MRCFNRHDDGVPVHYMAQPCWIVLGDPLPPPGKDALPFWSPAEYECFKGGPWAGPYTRYHPTKADA